MRQQDFLWFVIGGASVPCFKWTIWSVFGVLVVMLVFSYGLT